MNELTLIDNQTIQDKIHTIRGVQVMIDRDLAFLYEVETKALNQAVKRNESRFPDDFRFQLDDNEKDELVTNCVTALLQNIEAFNCKSLCFYRAWSIYARFCIKKRYSYKS